MGNHVPKKRPSKIEPEEPRPIEELVADIVPASPKIKTAKIVIIGDNKTGKSSLATRFADDTFAKKQKPKPEIETKTKAILATLQLQISVQHNSIINDAK